VQFVQIHIKANMRLKIHHQLLADGAKGLNLNITVDPGVQASITEQIEATAQHKHAYWVNRDLQVKKHARLDNSAMMHLEQNVTVLQSTRAQVAQSGMYGCYHVVSGGRCFRHFQQVHLQERKARYQLIGIGLGAGKGCYDHNVLVKHEASNTYSEQICPQVLREHALSNFTSRVQVCAQVANIKSSQLNHNLLLDQTARALTAPELEIYADAVECAHGTTVGAVDEAAVFYLRARGLSQKAAESLLVAGFLQAVIPEIPQQHQERAQHLVHDYLKEIC
jgi:Fe-S cluster assembly protein SufD